MFELIDAEENLNVAVVGIGRAGCSIISKISSGIEDIATLYYMHSYEEYLIDNDYKNSLSIEIPETSKYGTNGEAYLGFNCAKKNEEKIILALKDCHMVFLVSGLGGGTGSGALPYVLDLLRDRDILSIALVSLPFDFEGERKKRIAISSYNKIKESSDSVIVFNNNLILDNYSDTGSQNEIFHFSNTLMSTAIYGLAGLISKPGLINVDLSDVKTCLKDMGVSTVGMGVASSEDRALHATENCLHSTLFNQFDISKAKSFLVSITAGLDMGIYEFEEVSSRIREVVSDDATVVIGTVIDPDLTDSIEVVMTVSGLEDNIDCNNDLNFNYSEIYRSITFEPEYIQAGISILSYFGDIIKQKYSNIDVNIRIERNDTSVTLIVESDKEVVEKIEKTLYEYGEIVKGNLLPESLLESQLDIEKLKMKLEMSAMEVRHNQNIIKLYSDQQEDTRNRIDNLDAEIKLLHDLLGDSLKGSNEVIPLLINNYSNTIDKNIQIIKKMLKAGISTKEDEETIISVIQEVEKQDKTVLGKVQDLFLNTVYGITGNSTYDFLIKLINS